jgi:hypothetical protein
VKTALIILGLAAAYLVGQLLMVWRSRNDNLPAPPPGGWKKQDNWDEGDDKDDDRPPPPRPR